MPINRYLFIFSFFLFAAGVTLTSSTFYTYGKLSNKCVSHQVQIGMNILLMLSIIMTIVPLIQLYCHSSCKCPQENLKYKFVIIFLLVLIITVSSVVLNGLTDDCDSKEIKTLMIGLITTSSIILCLFFVLPIIMPIAFSKGGDVSETPSDISSVNDSVAPI
jgi:hypothetical protein